MDSLTARRETAAVAPIAARLTSEDNNVAAAAAQFLGTIGGQASFDILGKFLPNCPAAILPTAQSALIRSGLSLPKTIPGVTDALVALWPNAANASVRFQISAP
jgi:hypothetical protein